MTEEQTNEQIATNEGDVEGQMLSIEAPAIAAKVDRIPDEGDDVEGQALVLDSQAIAMGRSPEEEDDVEGHRLDSVANKIDID